MLTRPKEFDVLATMNLNGDYLSDALAAQVGGIGIAPGGNINYDTGHAVFEADAIIGAMDKTIAQKTVTYDFARLMDGATEVKCSEFADHMIENM